MSDFKHLYFVYYKRNTNLRENPNITFEEVTKGNDYVFVMTHITNNLERLFSYMQGDNWSPNGEARSYIESLDLDHTSMVVGDVALDIYTGSMYECARAGWNRVYKTQ